MKVAGAEESEQRQVPSFTAQRQRRIARSSFELAQLGHCVLMLDAGLRAEDQRGPGATRSAHCRQQRTCVEKCQACQRGKREAEIAGSPGALGEPMEISKLLSRPCSLATQACS